MEIRRKEHPNPQWERKEWVNLNGEWEFEFDFCKSALNREKYNSQELQGRINVPFCPESELSGIEFKDFIPAACYMKKIHISEENLENRVIIHFGAVDYRAYLYVNGKKVGEHIGGYTSFEFEITKYLEIGENRIFLYAEDDVRCGTQCAGKQAIKCNSYSVYYTRTTGIWQTVWLEFVPRNYIKNAKFYSDIEKGAISVVGEVVGKGTLQAKAFFDGKEMGQIKKNVSGAFTFEMSLEEKRLWNVGEGNIYDLEFTFEEDRVKSYFGLRKVEFDQYKFLINGKSVFQRLVLDQGFYREGIYTAPDEEEFVNDIKRSLDAGFNGARLHEKVFEPRFLYHADKMGYLCWGEYPNWGLNRFNEANLVSDAIMGWSEAVDRDFNHPSIVCWCPFNETWTYSEKLTDGRLLKTLYRMTKKLDPTRPCVDASGNYHVETDIYDLHDYDQNPDTFKNRYESFALTGDYDIENYGPEEAPFFTAHQEYIKGVPSFISEYGGIKWDLDYMENADADRLVSWGYGEAPKTEEEFIDRYKRLTETLLFNPNMCGFCYTQLYDVEQERNGLYTYTREPKFDMKIFQEINSQVAAIEK